MNTRSVRTTDIQKGVCLACHHESSVALSGVHDTRFGIKGDFQIMQCARCGLEYLHPTPTASELNKLYADFYNFGGENNSRYTRLREMLLSSRFYRLWLLVDGDIAFHSRRGAGKLIDIGCNEGRGLRRYRKNGFDTEGLEPNERAASAARSEGFNVFTQPLEQLENDNAYDKVVLANVLEHSLDPQNMLLQVKRILKPGGEVWISCPNSRSWLRQLFGRFWINWHVPFHIYHFSPETLAHVLKETGFRSIKITQKTPAMWVSHSIIARLFAKAGEQTKELRAPLLVGTLTILIRAFMFPLMWAGNRFGRGDCLVVTAINDEL